MKIRSKRVAKEQAEVSMTSFPILSEIAHKIDDDIALYSQMKQDFPQLEDLFDSLLSISYQKQGLVDTFKTAATIENSDDIMTGEEKAMALLNSDCCFAEPASDTDLIVAMMNDEAAQLLQATESVSAKEYSENTPHFRDRVEALQIAAEILPSNYYTEFSKIFANKGYVNSVYGDDFLRAPDRDIEELYYSVASFVADILNDEYKRDKISSTQLSQLVDVLQLQVTYSAPTPVFFSKPVTESVDAQERWVQVNLKATDEYRYCGCGGRSWVMKDSTDIDTWPTKEAAIEDGKNNYKPSFKYRRDWGVELLNPASATEDLLFDYTTDDVKKLKELIAQEPDPLKKKYLEHCLAKAKYETISEKHKAAEGLSDGMSIEDIAKRHNVSPDIIRAQVEQGKEVEKEHTDNEEEAKRIALDHLFEIPDYYTRLTKMERDAGVTEGIEDTTHKYIVTMYQRYPIWEPAEGGYYYNGIEEVGRTEELNSVEDAKHALVQVANDEGFEYIREDIGYAADKEHHSYVGEGSFLQIESDTDPDYDKIGSRVSGWHAYESVSNKSDTQISPQKNLKMPKVPEGIGVAAEDTVKQGNYWVNKGKEGTHGKFRTKKAADAQRRAMFAGGYDAAEGIAFGNHSNSYPTADVTNKYNESQQFKSKFISDGDYTKYKTLDELAADLIANPAKIANIFDVAKSFNKTVTEVRDFFKHNYAGRYMFVELPTKAGNIQFRAY